MTPPATGAPFLALSRADPAVDPAAFLVNDVHSQLNATRVAGIIEPKSPDEVCDVVTRAKAAGACVSIAGGRHAMGGQQFGRSTLLVDTRGLDRVTAFDAERGVVSVEGGIQWPALIASLQAAQAGRARPWGIVQKQTGADRLSIGGALACNAHGRGLTLEPIVSQVEAFDLVGASGHRVTCSRTCNPHLFRLAIGGYGLFGIVTRVELRLRPRVKMRRDVTLAETAEVMDLFDRRIDDGYEYGDYQFATDDASDEFLRRGVLSCYQPASAEVPLTENPIGFDADDWSRLTYLSHADKSRAFAMYASRYLETSGQVYWSDDQLAGPYFEDYHAGLDRALGARVKGSEMITEVYVPRPRFAAFMSEARIALRQSHANVIYGTVRVIEKDDETFLPWARERFACIVFNLHVDHAARAIAAAADRFRDLIDLAIAHGGSYYLTYHRWARKDQVERCYPRMRDFFALKRRHDPQEVFQSTWYRHYREMFDDGSDTA